MEIEYLSIIRDTVVQILNYSQADLDKFHLDFALIF